MTINPAAVALAPHKVAPPEGVRLPRVQNAAKRCF